MANEVVLTLRANDQASAEAARALGEVRREVEATADAASRAADEQSGDLALVRAQYGQVAEAVEDLRPGIERARGLVEEFARAAASGGEGVEAALGNAEQAVEDLSQRIAGLRAAGQSVGALEAEVEGLRAQLAQVEQVAPALARAEQSLQNFQQQATTGGRGLETAFARSEFAVRELERGIDALRASGGDVRALEREAERLREGMARGAETAGRFRAAQKEAGDQLKITTRSAGEFEGQITSLEDVLNSVDSRLGSAAVKFAAVGVALGIVEQLGRDVARSLAETAVELGASEEGARKFAETLESKFSANPIRVLAGQFREVRASQNEFFDNLSSRLKEAGDIAGSERVQSIRRFLRLDSEDIAAAKKFAESIEGQRAAVEARTKAIVRGAEIIREDGVVTKETAAAVVKAIDDQQAALKRLGETAPELDSLRRQFKRLADGVKDDSDVVERRLAEIASRFNAIGAGSEASIGEGLTALQRFTAEVEASGTVTSQQATLIVAQSKRIVEAIETLPLAQREGAREIVENLRSVIAHYSELAVGAKEALEIVGGVTREQVNRSVEALREYAAEVERGGGATVEQKEKIVRAVDAIRAQVQELPADQREAVRETLEELELLREGYAETAAVVLRTFGIETPDAIRRSADQVHALAETFGGLGAVTREQAERVHAEALKVLESIALLPVGQRQALEEVTAALRETVSEYGLAAERQKEFAIDVEKAERESLRRRREALKELTGDLAASLDSLLERLDRLKTESGEVGGEGLAELKRELQGLRERQETGLVSQEELDRIFEIEDALKEAGEGAARFDSSLRDAAESSSAVVASQEDVDSVLRDLLGTLGQNREAWASLGPAAREAIETQLGQLQALGNQGGATADAIRGVFGTIREVFQGAGVDVSALDQVIEQAGGGVLDLNSAFAQLDRGAASAEESLAGVGRGAEAGAKGQEKFREDSKKTAEEVGKLSKQVEESTRKINAGFATWRGILKEIPAEIEKCILAAQRLSNVSLGSAAASVGGAPS